ncbi:MAG TPA: hypothetical protein VK968_17670, partial [Roseimicrobium sp.]|nr:hypothetical protein [Roseimicrobium sp.]
MNARQGFFCDKKEMDHGLMMPEQKRWAVSAARKTVKRVLHSNRKFIEYLPSIGCCLLRNKSNPSTELPHQATMNSPSHPAKRDEIQSELVVFPSINGRKITAYVDCGGAPENATGYVVVAPKYGETKKNNLQLAYYLAANGLLVLRFDHTNHVGESEGGIVDFTFPSAIEDMRASVDYLERRFSAKKVTLIANSLSVRPAIRTFCKDDRIATLISVVGVVNFRSTVSIVYQRDLVGDHIAGVHHGVTDILGHEVNVAHFMDSCIAEKMHDYDGAMQDVERADGKLFFFYADKDAWVDSKDVKSLEKDFDHVHAREIKGAMHELRENPEGAEQALKEIVYVALHGRLGEVHELAQLVIPPKKTYLKQNRIERERLKKAEPIKETEREFWQAYLGKYDILEKVFDYQEYLDLIGERLGEIKDGHIVFDVGCGNGLFGVWCLRDILIKRRAEFGINPVYFGLDLTYKGLSEALQKHQAARFEPGKQRMAATAGGLDMIYTPFDLDTLKSD